MTATLTLAQVFADLADEIRHGDTATATLPDGVTLTATRRYDTDHSLAEDGDWYGRIEYRDYRDVRKPRPDWCDGAARKFEGRDGFVWWQPPTDTTDRETLDQIAARVRGYVREDWDYMGVVLALTPAPCEHGQLVDRKASLWGIESDASPDYLAEILADLYGECAA